MKTLATQNRKNISRLSAILFMSASALFFNSCQKEDIMAPRPQKGMEPYSRNEVSRTAPSNLVETPVSKSVNSNLNSTASFIILKIDHSSANTKQPDYKIAVNTDGTVLFTGRKNVAALGERKFMVSKEIIANIRSMFLNNNFAELESMPFTLDMALATTSFTPQNNMEEITKIDYNKGNPSKLMELRKAAETMLDISKFIYIKTTADNLEEINLQHIN